MNEGGYRNRCSYQPRPKVPKDVLETRIMVENRGIDPCGVEKILRTVELDTAGGGWFCTRE